MRRLEKSGAEYLNKLFSQILVSMIVFFYAAGNLLIASGWAYFIVDFVWTAIASLVVTMRNPEVLNQRNVPYKHNTRKWDKVLLFLYLVIDSFVIPAASGMELGRKNSTSIDLALFIPGFCVYSFASLLVISAMTQNVFFEITARIQDDRNQVVVTGGAYRFVRHPGYLSFILNSLSIPMLLGSYSALICALAVTLIIVMRTALEDAMLMKHLEGYGDYARNVRYRLIPLVW